MYVPSAFAVTDPAALGAMIGRLPFGCLVTHGPEGLYASHLPLLHDRDRGLLMGHLARANPHRSLASDQEALIVLQGPSAYVSPNGYASKAVDGRVVPTWNYEAVHLYGRIRWREDAAWLRANVAALTDRFEADQPAPWAIGDAPADFTSGLLKGIVGMEFAITRIEAKQKLSQNRSAADRAGVIAALSAGAHDQDRAVAALMAKLDPD
jgi:transcriptional regulator